MLNTIYRRRQELSLTRAELCRTANIYPNQLSRLENASTKVGPKVQERISKALKLPSSELFDQNGWPIELDEVPA